MIFLVIIIISIQKRKHFFQFETFQLSHSVDHICEDPYLALG